MAAKRKKSRGKLASSNSPHSSPTDLLESKTAAPGRSPDEAAIKTGELHESLDEALWGETAAWLDRPKIHTGIFQFAEHDQRAVSLGHSFPDLVKREKKRKELNDELGWTLKRFETFKKHVVAFRRDHSIESYLEIRRSFPEVEIQVGQLGGLDPLFALEETFKKYGVEPNLIAAALDGAPQSIDELSLHLLSLLLKREKIPSGQPGSITKKRAAIPNSMVGYLIAVMLEGMDWSGNPLALPASLIVLIRNQLCGVEPDLHKEYLAKKRRKDAIYQIVQSDLPCDGLSVRRLAELTGEPKSTVARWRRDPSFSKEVEDLRGGIAEWSKKRRSKPFVDK